MHWDKRDLSIDTLLNHLSFHLNSTFNIKISSARAEAFWFVPGSILGLDPGGAPCWATAMRIKKWRGSFCITIHKYPVTKKSKIEKTQTKYRDSTPLKYKVLVFRKGRSKRRDTVQLREICENKIALIVFTKIDSENYRTSIIRQKCLCNISVPQKIARQLLKNLHFFWASFA